MCMLRFRVTVALAALLLPSALARAADQFFDSAGVRIRYTDEGQGPPVVLIHGFTASGDMNWRIPGMVAALAKDYRVITLDNRGHGKSDKPTEATEYGANMADDVLRLLDHLKIEKAHFVGYSMGGMITLKLTAVAPERMLSAVVAGMGWTPLGPIAAEREADGERRGNPSLRACARAFPQLGITREELQAIKVSMIVIIGGDDGLLARRVKPLAEVRPDIPVIEIEGANHLTCVFRPELRQSVREFLDKQVAAAGALGGEAKE
ncbi:MAG: alpha/beta fold hydrolase [Pirellulales bacterium]